MYTVNQYLDMLTKLQAEGAGELLMLGIEGSSGVMSEIGSPQITQIDDSGEMPEADISGLDDGADYVCVYLGN